MVETRRAPTVAHRQANIDSLRQLDWRAFERLVGEAFRRLGYQITETGQGGADGGIDLVLRKNNRKTIVQVKQWKTSSVGAPVVREMYGLMMHCRADAVAIVCLGRFTKEAWSFAHNKPIELISGDKLFQMIQAAQERT
jgi:restriction system protein